MEELSENEYLLCRFLDQLTWGKGVDKPDILMGDIVNEFPGRTKDEITRTINKLKKKGIVISYTDSIITVNKKKFNRFF